jgi:hypothetical protein
VTFSVTLCPVEGEPSILRRVTAANPEGALAAAGLDLGRVFFLGGVGTARPGDANAYGLLPEGGRIGDRPVAVPVYVVRVLA